MHHVIEALLEPLQKEKILRYPRVGHVSSQLFHSSPSTPSFLRRTPLTPLIFTSPCDEGDDYNSHCNCEAKTISTMVTTAIFFTSHTSSCMCAWGCGLWRRRRRRPRWSLGEEIGDARRRVNDNCATKSTLAIATRERLLFVRERLDRLSPAVPRILLNPGIPAVTRLVPHSPSF